MLSEMSGTDAQSRFDGREIPQHLFWLPCGVFLRDQGIVVTNTQPLYWRGGRGVQRKQENEPFLVQVKMISNQLQSILVFKLKTTTTGSIFLKTRGQVARTDGNDQYLHVPYEFPTASSFLAAVGNKLWL